MTPVIVDCDPGWDDALALFAILAEHDAFDVRATGAVFGNRPIGDTLDNLRTIVSLCGRDDVLVAAGRAAPLLAPPHQAPWIDAPQPEFPATARAGLAAADAVSLYASVLNASATPVSIVALGPLTNIAELLTQHPNAADRIAEIVLLGGALKTGNVSPYAEFNFFMDARAASIVLSSPVAKRIIPADIAEAAPLTQATLDALATQQSAVASAASGLISQYLALNRASPEQVSIYDAYAPILMLSPQWFETESHAADVDCSLGETHGALVLGNGPANCKIVTRINAAAALERFLAAMAHWR